LIAALAFGGIPAQAQQGPIQATVLESVDLPGLPPRSTDLPHDHARDAARRKVSSCNRA
jgi:hypothetical protein